MKKFIIAILYCFPIALVSQTASIDKGCLPLTVQFEAPNASGYFWDFGDGVSSDLQNAEHIYTTAGKYTVWLYEGSASGPTVGSVDIEVYADLVVDLQSDVRSGCADVPINFTSLVTSSPEVIVQSYFWTFGNGARSTNENPDYIYKETGIYDVSLEVETNFPDCNKTIIRENQVRILEADFRLNSISFCDSPATIIPSAITASVSGYEYIWTLDGEVISNNRDLGSFQITKRGSSSLRLTVRGPDGCEHFREATIRIDSPKIELDTITKYCLDTPLTFSNNTISNDHTWTFGQDAVYVDGEENKKAPTVIYTSPGLKAITYSTSRNSCRSDTSFFITIEETLAEFHIEHGALCNSSIPITLTAVHQGLGSYTWNNNSTPSGEVVSVAFDFPVRDPEYINKEEFIYFSLTVDTGYGCSDTYKDSLAVQLPEAFFVPDSVIGLAPLTIGFTDYSEATEPIVNWIWHFEDGTVLEGDPNVEHTFQEGYDQFVQLEIVTASGCRDFSKKTLITALGQSGGGNGNGGGGGQCEIGGRPAEDAIICVGQPLPYVVDVGLDVHVETDEGRFNHCWNTNRGVHTFMYPGEYPIVVLRETRGFERRRDVVGTLTVLGARAEIGYKKTCDDNSFVDLWSNSLGADGLKWYYEGKLISQDSAFTYQLPGVGSHQIILEALSDDSPCPPHRDTVEVYVAELTAALSMESVQICDGVDYLVDASATLGLGDNCNPSYYWTLEGMRPRNTINPIISQSFNSGKQEVALTVVDVNGCEADAAINIEVFGITPEFELDSSICLPFKHQFENFTISDTTVVSWDWSFGSTESAPEHTITTANLPSTEGDPDSLWIELTMQDALGCVDTLRKFTRVYVPETSFKFLPSFCQGDTHLMTTDDFTTEGGQLAFEWNFGPFGISNERSTYVTFDSAGIHTVQLVYWPEGTVCYDTITATLPVLETPVAAFSTSVDTMDFVCFPHTVDFNNESSVDGSISYFWNFDNGSTSTVVDPASTFDRGTYTVSLRATSSLGCEDVLSKDLNFIGPDGDLVVSDNHLCLGETLTVELRNPIDISTYDWDLGDGTVLKEEGTISHTYTFVPDNEATTINLVLKSEDTGCETIKSVDVGIHPIPSVSFDTSADGHDTLCHPYPLMLSSTGDDWAGMSYTWDLGNGQTASGETASELYARGDYELSLTGTSRWGCADSEMDTLTIVGPDGDLVADAYALCQGDTLRVEVLNLIETSTFEWNFMNDNIVLTDSNVVYNHYVEHPGDPTQVAVTLHSLDSGCEITKVIDLEIYEIAADFELDTEYDHCRGLVRLENNSIGADEYLWTLDEGVTTAELDPIHSYARDGEVDVQLLVTDSSTGCTAETTKSIPITMENEFYGFPNVFSPNDDGVNDKFRIVIPERYLDVVTVTAFKVFDRWGQLLYDRVDPEGWDGYYQGQRLPEDVYAYYLEAEIESCKVVSSKGSVTLVR